MRGLLVIVFATLCTSSLAQLKIEGRNVFLDTLTSTILATVPERMFDKEVVLHLEKEQGWQQVSINGTVVSDGNVPFSDLSAEQKWEVKAIKDDGKELLASLQFTFLPIIQLIANPTGEGTEKEEFGYDYKQATVLFSHPDCSVTDTLMAWIKWRGGTTNTASKHKRNYKINFDVDQRFFGLRSDDKWMLDAGQPDVFRLRNRIAMDLWNKMARKPYYAAQEPKALNGVRGNVVEMFLGNEWRGIYNLSEFMDRKQLKLKKMDSNTGIIHGCLYKGVSFNKTAMFDFFASYDNTTDVFFGYEMKYPELDDSDTIDWAPLVAANNFVQSSTDEDFKEHLVDYFDMPVLMDYNIFFNVVNAVDNTGKNMYWAIYDKTTTKCLTPTPWDLDATFGQRWGGQLVVESGEGFFNAPDFKLDFELLLTYRLFRDNFNDYVGQLNARYQQLRQPGQPLHTDSIIAIVTHYYQTIKNSGAAKRETDKWSGDSDMWGDVINFDKEYLYICNWIRRRMKFIDETQLPLFYKPSYFEELGMESPSISLNVSNDVYDLYGRKVSSNVTMGLKPGVYVKDGRKFVVR